MDIDDEWTQFENDNYNINSITKIENKHVINNIPKASELYISTKTKIAKFNQSFDLSDIFWKLPIIKYQERKIGIIKKQMKINLTTTEQVKELEKKLNDTKDYLYHSQILKINKSRKTKFKDIRKINVGLSNKDLLTFKKKNKGAFYNCFVVIVRIKKKNNIFKEINIKLFNTGQLEIPGIRDDDDLYDALNIFSDILKNIIKKDIKYVKNNIRNVLINSNFSCNFFINRNKLYNLLKNKYNIDVIYDPCSYPGIQCKYYYNNKLNGICNCEKKCKKKEGKCLEISFMIFRTGSILIVGNCEEYVVNIIYNFILNILKTEYSDIYIKGEIIKKKKRKLIRKK